MSTATRHTSTTARPATRRTAIPAMAVADLVLAAVLFAVAILDPFGLSNAARWTVAGLGDLALLLAGVGIYRSRRARAGTAGRR